MKAGSNARPLVAFGTAVPAQIAFFAGLTAVTARVTVHLPGTPVPLTMQVLAVLLAGTLLGPRKGAASQVAYLLAIAAGLPLDAKGMGPATFAGPTAGYLFAFVGAAFAAGWLRQRLPRGLAGAFVASCAAVLGLYAFGTLWLSVYLGSNLRVAWSLGAVPFLTADLAKALLCAGITVASTSRRGARPPR